MGVVMNSYLTVTPSITLIYTITLAHHIRSRFLNCPLLNLSGFTNFAVNDLILYLIYKAGSIDKDEYINRLIHAYKIE